MNSDQRKELFALVSWLQTFDDFPFEICLPGKDYDADKVNEMLSTIEVTR